MEAVLHRVLDMTRPRRERRERRLQRDLGLEPRDEGIADARRGFVENGALDHLTDQSHFTRALGFDFLAGHDEKARRFLVDEAAQITGHEARRQIVRHLREAETCLARRDRYVELLHEAERRA